jgi:hypothetical protein
MRNRPDGSKLIVKDGAVTGFRSVIIFAPSIQTGAVVLANKGSCAAPKIGNQLMMAMNGAGGNEPETTPEDDK